MAKYKLNESGSKSTNCDILGENLNNYIVRFGNGQIQEVVKDKVSDLNEIDEGVLDLVRKAGEGVRDFGKKVGSAVKNAAEAVKTFFANAFKAAGFVFFKDEDGNPMGAVHPINTMIGAMECKAINFVPADSLVEQAREIGVVPRIVSNFELSGEYDGPLGAEPLDLIGEGLSYGNFINCILNEENKIDSEESGNLIKLTYKDSAHPSLTIHDLSTERIKNFLLKEYNRRYDGDVSDDMLPLFIWGAPGIGKTAMLSGLRDVIKEKTGGDRPNLIVIAASSINEDSCSFPAEVKKAVFDAISKSYREKNVVTDLPKDWLPVYDPDSKVAEGERCLANGGYYDAEKDEWIDGPGGIFLIDEFTRMGPGAKAILYTLPNSRYFGTKSMTIGDRWIIVAAANRLSDLTGRALSDAKSNMLDSAGVTRFYKCNFVPKFEEWKDWALSSDGKGRTNVLKDVVDYVEYSTTDVGRSASSVVNQWGDYYRVDKYAQSGDLGMNQSACSPRTWTSFSNTIRGYIKGESNTSNMFGMNMYDDLQAMVSDPEGKEIVQDAGYMLMGYYPTNRFLAWLNSVSFTKADAKTVWEKGGSVKYAFANNLNISDVKNQFETIVIPLLKSEYPGGKIPETGALPEYVENFVDFLISVFPKNNGGKTSPTSQFNGIINRFEKVFGVELLNAVGISNSPYAESINKIADFTAQNNSTI